ncbi:helix-turn-helix domain-containing protein [Actinoallomurus soli]|nr:helix-turn-helix domain-containing protein [Actinoallomurus soli]MCO5973753.1 helix-turn-helix domain-containing protein [Actinoallomurus soli]
MSTTPLLHTPDEAAEKLRCKPSWLKEQARKRRIPFTFIGGAYRFTDAHL